MGDKNRPRSKTGRSPSSNQLKDRQRSVSKTDSVAAPPEADKVENTIPWDILSEEQIMELLICSPEDLLAKVCTIFSCPNTHVNLANSNLADAYMLAIYYAKQCSFPQLQLGGFITLFNHLLQLFKQQKELIDLVSVSSELLAGKTDFREGEKFDFFSPPQVLQISEYLESTLFQHYHLYKYTLLQEQAETIISLDKIVLTCPPLGSFDPPPLAEGISEADIELYSHVVESEVEVEEEVQEHVCESRDVDTQAGENPDTNKPKPPVSLANVQSVLDTVGDDMLDKFSKNIQSKCQDKETQYLNRLNKVKKAID